MVTNGDGSPEFSDAALGEVGSSMNLSCSRCVLFAVAMSVPIGVAIDV